MPLETETKGPFTTGEVPERIEHIFTDKDGAVIDLTGYSIRLVVRKPDATVEVLNASLVSAVNGIVGYEWVDGDIDQEGVYELQFWAGNTAKRIASKVIKLEIFDGPGPAPAI